MSKKSVPRVEQLKKLLEVEKALDHIRDLTMKMKESSELARVIKVVFQEAIKLGFGAKACDLVILDRVTGGSEFWISGELDSEDVIYFKLPKLRNKHYLEGLEAWKKRKKLRSTDLKGRSCQTYMRQMTDHMYDSNLPPNVASFLKGLPAVHHTEAYMRYGYFRVASVEPLQKNEENTLKRFAQVFAQTYQRFLDLQKAEAQAREAQIEASLERVRASAMAMHKSEELTKVAKVLYKELKRLDLTQSATCGFVIVDELNNTQHNYGTPADKNFLEYFQFPLSGDLILRKRYEAWKSKEPVFHQRVGGQKLQNHLSVVMPDEGISEVEKVAKLDMPDPTHFYLGNFAHGYLQIIASDTLSDDQIKLLPRFAKVFEQAYTRFLDLQKAEAQAREAKIEVALERVRAASMTMQKSEELPKIVGVVFERLQELGFGLDGAAFIGIPIEESKEIEMWIADEEQSYPACFRLPYYDSPAIKDFWEERKAGKDFISKTYSFDQKNHWFKFAFKHTSLTNLSRERKTWILKQPCLLQAFAFSENSLLGIHCHFDKTLSREEIDILKRFSKVFEQSYVRFLDLKKAESQAREAEIQLALERVRARTMAMQHSDELSETSFLLAQQVRELGIKAWGCAFHIYADNKEGDFEWFSNEEGYLPFYKTPRKKFFKRFYEKRQNGITLFIEEFKGKACADHYNYMMTLPVVGEALISLVDSGKSLPTSQIDHVLYFRHGYLLFITYEHVPEAHEIFERFTKEFEQTYTRFLDLQKAEAQAREAEIQLALERVRARTMAMQHSEELQDVINKLFHEFQGLRIDIDTSFILADYKPDKTLGLDIWVTNNEGSYAQKINTPYLETNPPQVKFYEALWSGQEFYSGQFTKKEKNTYFRYAFRHSPQLGALSDDRKKLILDGSGWIWSAIIFNNVVLCIQRYNTIPFSKEENNILRRFGEELNQTYTRFLDLQKAEAQAREAQIEAALERVRSRSMGMQKSEELREVIQLVFEQFVQLGFNIDSAQFDPTFRETDDLNMWVAVPGQPYSSKIHVPYFDHIVFNDIRKAKENKKTDFLIRLYNLEEKNEFFKHFFQYVPTIPKERQQHIFNSKGLARSTVFLDTINLGIQNYSGIPFTDAENSILRLFGRVFAQTYTRFLDLQKAEAQARESQIEAALERIRSRSLAMHKSEELVEVATVLHNELRSLNVREFSETSIVVHDEPSQKLIVWGARTGSGSLEKAVFPLLGDQILQKLYDVWRQQKDFFTLKVEGAALRKHIDFVFPKATRTAQENEAIKSMPDPTFFHCAFYCMGYLELMADKDLSEDSASILVRFAKVFDQAYTRFLDLQKAEAQAREAQIEAALERVRAQTMAMHNSGDVGNCVIKMFGELTALGVDEGTRFGIGILNHDNENNQLWTALKEGEEVKMHIGNLDMTSHPLLESARKSWKAQVPFHKYVLEGKDLLNYYQMINNAPDYKLRIAIDKLPKKEIHYGFIFDHGFFYAFSPREFEPELINIIQRFSSLFAQTYRRYLDLVKAEAQAREAEIELALERVRARTMAMQKSEELKDVVKEIFDQLAHLRINAEHAGIVVDYEPKKDWHFWVAETQDIPAKITVPYLDLVWDRQFTKAKKEGKDFFTTLMDFDEKNSFYKELLPHIEGLTKKARDFYFSCPGLAISTAIQKDIGLYIENFSGSPYSGEENDILKRFAKVFQQTYTRFLDLQKAEAQAREAQIEAAVERVRASAMSMHHSVDLKEVVAVLYQQINHLKIVAWGCGITIFNKKENYLELWISMSGKSVLPESYKIYNQEHPQISELWRIWENKLDNQHIDLIGPLKKDYDAYVFKHTELRNLPPAMKKAIRSQPDSFASFAYMNCGLIALYESTSSLSETSFSVLQRFAKVFDQAYTRFLDLQKAEAQAREAQIEAALERVRSRTMAMHQSDELSETAAVLFEQLRVLGNTPERINLGIFKENSLIEWWITTQEGLQIKKKFITKFDDHPVLKSMISAWKAKEKSNVVTLSGEAVTNWIQYITQFLGMPVNPNLVQEKRFLSSAFFSQGLIGTTTSEPLSTETIHLLERFAGVFEQTYIRFLDLQKAEAQAREAQIEAALERIRGRAMAMHHSNELLDVAIVLRKEIAQLDNLQLESSVVHLYPEDSDTLKAWYSFHLLGTASDQLVNRFADFPVNSTEFTREILRKYHSDESTYSIASKGKKLRDWYKVLDRVLPEVVEYDSKGKMIVPPILHYNFSKFSGGALMMVTHKPISEETRDLWRRAASVFDLSYRRFLDLQKAETQAREVEIELALERVRARTMAMQHSNELTEVVAVLYEQMNTLEFATMGCELVLCDPQREELQFWSSTPEQSLLPECYPIPRKIHPFFQQVWKTWIKQTPRLVYSIEGSEKREFDDLIFNQTAFKQFPNKVKKWIRSGTKDVFSLATMKYGLLEAVDDQPLSEDKFPILERFAKVFEQTYTRFLDLQKAEAQAREAQIEASLERVRSASLAMHQTQDLNSVLKTMFYQLNELGTVFERCVIWTFNESDKSAIWWAANPEAEMGTETFEIPFQKHPVYKTYWKAWKERKRRFYYKLSGKNKESWDEVLFSSTGLKKLPKEVQKGMQTPKTVYLYNTFQDFGVLFVSTLEEISKENFDIIQRFGTVFNQSYTRFLDLQKAEAQALEAQIEVALERVRAASMAMHKSEELPQVALVLLEQLEALGVSDLDCGINIVDTDTKDFISYSAHSINEGNQKEFHEFPRLNLNDFGFLRKTVELVDAGQMKFTLELKDELYQEIMSVWDKYGYPGLKNKKDFDAVGVIYLHVAQINRYSSISTTSLNTFSEEKMVILERMAKTFGMSYTRFLDLQKAEAQAREAQIETSLEKVRASSMAMHHADELSNVSSVLYEELNKLGITTFESCGFHIVDEENEIQHVYNFHIELKQLTRFQAPLKGDPIMDERYFAWKRQDKIFYQTVGGKALNDHLKYVSVQEMELGSSSSWTEKFGFPDPTHFHFGNFSRGYLHIIAAKELSEEQKAILGRFARVFDQTYTRFLDLQKAEAQIREAQIEASLERVRSRSMAMHTSEELWDVSSVVYEEFNKLGISKFESCGVTIVDEENEIQEIYNFHIDLKQRTRFQAPMKGDRILDERYKAWKRKDKIVYQTIGGKELNDHLGYASAQDMELGSSSSWTEKFGFPDPTHFHFGNFSRGYLHIIGAEELSEEHKSFLGRFARVFDQTYTRFLDLQKAEAQAREAQIEAALERVRARALAMHDSKELGDVVRVVREQMALLGQAQLETIAIHLYPEEGDEFESWYAIRSPHRKKGEVLTGTTRFSKKDTAIAREMLLLYHSNKSEYKMELRGKILDEWQEMVVDRIPGMMEEWGDHKPNYQYWYFADFSGGSFVLIPREEPNEEAKELLKRSASVFDLAYRRYLDLKKAEKQAREGQIEAALERVRSRTMAMHQSNEIAEILGKIFEELTSLDIELTRCIIWTFDEEKQTVSWWLANPEAKSGAESFDMEFNNHPVFQDHVNAWKEKKQVWQYKLSGKRKTTWDNIIFNESDLSRLPLKVKNAMRSPETIYFTGTCNDFGILRTVSLEPVSDENVDIIQRFGRVLQQSFTRFGDVQKAEKQAIDAIKQSSLDRLRAEIASMRTTNDLNRITPLVWRELTTLGVPFFRCGVFIVNDSDKKINVYLSNPKGESLAAWKSDYDTTPLFRATVDHWKKQERYHTEWDKSQFMEFTKTLIDHGLVDNQSRYLSGKDAPEYLVLQMAPFKQGMLYVGSAEKLEPEHLELVESLADAFSVAYARYEDFKQLEQAKSRIENTLVELKAAQNQLIHSEKMASLGELTAGIAHEIQNPLNFVNNFSDINKELADEVLEEIRNGNMAEAEALISDIINNDKKILHHGKRAEEIVRSMLLHSRGSSGEKELTNINTLADEYLRLSYHGMRAKDKAFNTDFLLDLDENLPHLKVIQQDIGRVLLNLINNAFYATNEKKNATSADYKPKVTLSTRALKDSVEIRVRDNAGGIPKKVLDKIFQPFFTTKPTGQGTGLGLSLSYDIVTKGHGGKLEVETNEGKGSEFVINLPII